MSVAEGNGSAAKSASAFEKTSRGTSAMRNSAAELPAAYREAARQVREKYRHLYQLSVVENEDGGRSFHDARLVRAGRLNILLLRGDTVEMAFQHGRLLADEIPMGAAPQSARLVGDSIANVFGSRRKFEDRLLTGAQQILTRRLFAAAGRRIKAALGTDASLEEMIALADASGVAVAELVQAMFNPELLLILARYQGTRGVSDPAKTVLPTTCCSSFAAWGSATRDGELLIGRNLDYPLNGYFDRFPTVIYFEPPQPQQAYMSFVSAGIHNAGITAINEAGIFLASHVVPGTDVSLRGVPAIMAADQVIRRAKSFDEAVAIFRQLKPLSCWGYLLASTRERKVASLEMSSGHVTVREAEGDCLAQTNQFLSPAMRGFNLFLNRSVDEDAEGRYQRMQERVREANGQLDADGAISILGDQIDPQVKDVRGLGNTVGCHTTLGSLVFDPARGRALVSTGEAPASHSEFVELPLVGTFEQEHISAQIRRLEIADEFCRQHSEKVEALKVFIRAKVAYETRNDAAEAYDLLKQVAWNDPSNPAYFFQLGIFALKNGQYDEGLDALEAVFRTPYLTAQLRRLTHYYLGRTYAHLRKRANALEHLQVLLNDAGTDAKLRSAARRAARRVKIFGGYRLGKRSLCILMQHSDMLYY